MTKDAPLSYSLVHFKAVRNLTANFNTGFVISVNILIILKKFPFML